MSRPKKIPSRGETIHFFAAATLWVAQIKSLDSYDSNLEDRSQRNHELLILALRISVVI